MRPTSAGDGATQPAGKTSVPGRSTSSFLRRRTVPRSNSAIRLACESAPTLAQRALRSRCASSKHYDRVRSRSGADLENKSNRGTGIFPARRNL